MLDIGSNTGHLLVVDAHGGAAPLPAFSHKEPLRLAEHLDETGAVNDSGVAALDEVRRRRARGRRGQGLRGDAGLRHLGGPRRQQLRGRARARAAADRRRHRGAAGRGRGPADLPRRTPLVRLVVGPAGRLRHRWWLAGDRGRVRRGPRRRAVAAAGRRSAHPRLAAAARSDDDAIRKLRWKIRADIARDAGAVLRHGTPDHAVATSKTFRSLARICGAAPSAEGPLVRRSASGRRARRQDLRAGRHDGPRTWPPCPASRRAGPTRSSPVRSSPTR